MAADLVEQTVARVGKRNAPRDVGAQGARGDQGEVTRLHVPAVARGGENNRAERQQPRHLRDEVFTEQDLAEE